MLRGFSLHSAENSCILLEFVVQYQKVCRAVNRHGEIEEEIPMAENKRYITQVQENGNVMISEDVVATIVANAALEVEGIESLHTRKSWSGKNMKIAIADDNSLTIDCNVIVKFGYSVIDVAKNAQSAITSAVESMTGVTVTQTNVNVCHIARQ